MRIRKTAITFFLVLSLFPAFAQANQAGGKKTSAETLGIPPVLCPIHLAKTVTGTVTNVSLADESQGTKSEIVVLDGSGKAVTLLVKVTTTIYGPDSSAITLDKIMKGEKIRARYDISREGVSEALALYVIK